MPPPGSTLGRLAKLTGGRVVGDASAVVSDASHDSRNIGPGTLFVAVPGERFDGHDFAPQAVDAGAMAVCGQRALEVSVPQLLVTDTRKSMPVLAAEVHGHPDRSMRLVGVTGTNGKTTVTHLVEAIGVAAGEAVGLIGTIETRVGSHRFPNPRTTPESTDLQRLLRAMADAGASLAALEVSSHALALDRVSHVSFEVGAFTNLGRDHLDLHGDLESYFAAKCRLFELSRRAVVWMDDPYGRRLAATLTDPVRVGWSEEVRAEEISSNWKGSPFRLVMPSGVVAVHLSLVGRFSIANALVAAGCAYALGYSPQNVKEGLEAVSQIPGRFQLVSGDEPMAVVVDYAHTPDGIAAAVSTARSLVDGRVIVVVGAGGDRDVSKRPLMGAAAAAADLVVVTSDNPRSEDPDRIIDQVLAGVGTAQAVRVPDRRMAIRAAIESGGAGDMILILGKGHEPGQEIAGRVLAFNDREVASEELAVARRKAEI